MLTHPQHRYAQLRVSTVHTVQNFEVIIVSRLLYRLGRAAYTHRLKFIAVWLLLFAAAAVAAGALAKPPSNSFSIPGAESVEAQEEISRRFNTSEDELTAPTGMIVVKAKEGTLSDPEQAVKIDAIVDKLKHSDALKSKDMIVNPVAADAAMRQGNPNSADVDEQSPLSPDKTTGIIQVMFDAAKMQDVDKNKVADVTKLLKDNADGLDIAYTGNAFDGAEQPGMQSELMGVLVAAVVLLVTFGSLVAAGMPLATAIVGVLLGSLGINAASGLTDSIDQNTATLATMIGLAVGIDYALFILSRFRSELIQYVDGHNLTPKELAQRIRSIPRNERAHLAGLAVGKAGTAVVFAGLTVIIALVALVIINIPSMSAMSLGAAGTVAIAVLVAIGLLPAILGLWGTRAFAARMPFIKAPDPEQETPTMGARWVHMIRKHPALFLVAGVLTLALLAIPAAQLRLAMPTGGNAAAPGSPSRTAYTMIEDAFGPGRQAPMIALVDVASLPEQQRPEAFATAVRDFAGMDGVKNAQVAAVNDAGDAAQVMIIPSHDATDKRTVDLLHNLRDHKSDFQEQTGASYRITGMAPIVQDLSDRLSGVLIPYVAIVVALAFVLLMVVFRSIWVPLIAALGFALSVAATFGITVLIWQEGFAGLVSDPQPLISQLPIILIGIVFGLAMDYQVFLVTRMREGYHHGMNAGPAVVYGFKHGARVVTAAALIMISVFAAFMFMDLQLIKVMGFALATAVLFDAFIVRMTIIPATMFLLDARAWSIPRWLGRLLPNVDIEGEKLTSGLA